MATPTASAYTIIEGKIEECGIKAHNEPEKKANEVASNNSPRCCGDVSGHGENDKSGGTYRGDYHRMFHI